MLLILSHAAHYVQLGLAQAPYLITMLVGSALKTREMWLFPLSTCVKITCQREKKANTLQLAADGTQAAEKWLIDSNQEEIDRF